MDRNVSQVQHVDILVLPETNLILVASVIEPMRAANRIAGRPLYDWTIYSPDGAPIETKSGIPIPVAGIFRPQRETSPLFILSSYNWQRSATSQLKMLLSQTARHRALMAGIESGSWLQAPGSRHAPVAADAGVIRFEDVTFAYVPGQPVLRNVSFEVRPGQRVAIVGATGSGKTTIVNLLLRFYDVQEGRITIGGADIRGMDLAALRGMFGLVLQDVYLFSGTIGDNVSLGHPSVTSAATARRWGCCRGHARVVAFLLLQSRGPTSSIRASRRGTGRGRRSRTAGDAWRCCKHKDRPPGAW